MSQPKFDWHDKVMVGFATLFVGLMLFTAGQQAERTYYSSAIINVLLAAFFGAIGLAIVAGKFAEFDNKVEAARREERRKASQVMEGMIDAMREAMEEAHKAEMVEAIIKDVTKGKKPQKVHCAKIAKAIHENLGLFAEVSINANGGFDVAYSENPLEMPAAGKKAAPGRSKAHDETAKRSDAARAKINKPLTKSQERRIAATKKASK